MTKGRENAYTDCARHHNENAKADKIYSRTTDANRKRMYDDGKDESRSSKKE